MNTIVTTLTKLPNYKIVKVTKITIFQHFLLPNRQIACKNLFPVSAMKAIVSVTTQFFLLNVISLILSEVVEPTVKVCEVDKCVRQDSCPHFAAVVDNLEEVGVDTEEYEDMIAIVRESVCNREEKGICCEDFSDLVGVRSILPRKRSCCR